MLNNTLLVETHGFSCPASHQHNSDFIRREIYSTTFFPEQLQELLRCHQNYSD